MQNNSLKQKFMQLNPKQKVGLILIPVIIFIIYIIVQFIIELPKTAKLNILLSPKDSRITINQQNFSVGEKKIEPGIYKVKIEREGFQTEEVEFSIEKDNVKYLYYCLQPDDNHQNWYQEHQADQKTCDEINQALNDIQKKEIMNDPVFSITPYHNDEKRFYIDSELKDDKITIRIRPLSCRADLKQILKQNALDYLRNHNINLDRYNIEYTEDC